MNSHLFRKSRLNAVALSLMMMLTTVFPVSFGAAVSAAEVATGTQGMAATAHPLASEAAIEILRQGGNAVDAAVAAAFAIGVVEPDGSGIGGGGAMVIYMNDSQSAEYIGYYHRAPMNIDKVSYDTETDRHTAKAVLVPGTVAGLVYTQEKFGTLPLATVMEPAIRYARDGFAIDGTLATLILDNNDWLAETGAAAETFLYEGFPIMEGDVLKQEELAKTLELVAEQGRDGFYRGPVAEALVKGLQAGGSAMTLEDLSNYKVVHSKPLAGTYRGYTILSADAPQSGSTIIESLNMLENADLAALGHYSQSALALHLMAETFKRSYADRWKFMGDPEMSYVPTMGLISKGLGRERFLDIDQYQAKPRNPRLTGYGNPAKYDHAVSASDLPYTTGQDKSSRFDDGDDDGRSTYDTWGEDLFDSYGATKKKQKVKKDKKDKGGLVDSTSHDDDFDEQEYDGHTTHISVVDKDGNVVALTQTLGTFFGSGQMINGVLLNCGMANYSQSSDPNLCRPGSLPRSSIAPTVVLNQNKPFLVLGSPGASRIICTVVELIVNIIDYKMNLIQANDAPRFYCQKYEDYLHLEAGISEEVEKKLSKMGHQVRTYASKDLFFGGAQIIMVDSTSGVFYGSADSRRGGVAIGF
ncbi:MAG TPA: gamma-glutamyltransferase family protein [candidate division Zixibacteria bacterium]|nr:gamma-glutamyltransferase family protein [candidate division Zixibacteria bacterium]